MIIRANIILEDEVKLGFVSINDTKFTSIMDEYDGDDYIDLSDYYIAPAIIETHIHGSFGYRFDEDLPYESKVKMVEGFLKAITSRGIVRIVPVMKEFFLEVLDEIDDTDKCSVLGVHLEGPYLVRQGEKGTPVVPPDIDTEYVNSLLNRYGKFIKIMSFSPEMEHSDELLSVLKKYNVIPSIAHSNLKSKESRTWFDKGIFDVTHLCNVMTGIHHRDIGLLGAALLDERVRCEVICDDIHVSNDMLRIIFNLKTKDSLVMISDGSCYAGLPVGSYPSYMDKTKSIFVNDEGLIKEETGRLAGSGLSIFHGVANLYNNCGINLHDIFKMASLNPATKIGVSDRYGSIRVGKIADFIVFDKDFDLLATYKDGKVVYRKGDKVLFNKGVNLC